MHALRDRAPGWEKEYDVSHILVTGQTAINIDVSARLGGALLPFAAIVIGLSLILLMIVFRSIAVPLKATFGYLLSVGAALGAVVAVFQWGWADGLLGESAGPIVSFLPIFVMGVLFGLAMDYEMFLVSAMRESYVQSGDPHGAVIHGFRASARVVTAAALIMTSVFVAFIPNGSSTIQPIALGLAVGVFVDAFVVRMTLVPAVLVLLGRGHGGCRAGWTGCFPRSTWRGPPCTARSSSRPGRPTTAWRRCWPGPRGPRGRRTGPALARPAEVTRVSGGPDLALVLSGRARPHGGKIVVDGLLLPEQREAVNRVATMVDLGGTRLRDTVADTVRERARLLSFSPRERRAYAARAGDLVDELSVAVGPRPVPSRRPWSSAPWRWPATRRCWCSSGSRGSASRTGCGSRCSATEIAAPRPPVVAGRQSAPPVRWPTRGGEHGRSAYGESGTRAGR